MKRLLLFALLALSFAAPAQVYRAPLVAAATSTGAATAVNLSTRGVYRTFIAYGTTSAGAGAATVLVQVATLSTGPFTTACTLTPTLQTTLAAGTADACTMSASWPFVRGNVSAISGTSAAVTLDAGLPQ